jgi:hypothetical protein
MDSLEGNFPVPRKRREEKVRSEILSMGKIEMTGEPEFESGMICEVVGVGLET